MIEQELSRTEPLITALVCTRGRGAAVAETVQSILAVNHPNFELLVMDQSEDEATQDALAPFRSDPRLRCLRSRTQGLGRARNLGLSEARGEIVVSTDDDCVVPPDWLSAMALVFKRNPNVAVAFCNVEAAPHDLRAGFIPAYCRTDSVLLTTVRDKCRARGIGAGIAVRRRQVLLLGGFDEMLGAGARFPSCEDGDMAVRALLKGHQVYETSTVAVQHAGFRTWEQGRELSRRDWVGIGAAYSKPLKCGHWRFVVVPAYELLRFAFWPPCADLLHGRKPRGLGRIAFFFQGFARGWRTPVDPETLRFMPPSTEEKDRTLSKRHNAMPENTAQHQPATVHPGDSSSVPSATRLHFIDGLSGLAMLVNGCCRLPIMPWRSWSSPWRR